MGRRPFSSTRPGVIKKLSGHQFPQPTPETEIHTKNIATTLIVAALALASSAAFAQQKMDDMNSMDMAKKPAAAASAATVHMATGMVKKVDPKSGAATATRMLRG